jgi:hypothetical protein
LRQEADDAPSTTAPSTTAPSTTEPRRDDVKMTDIDLGRSLDDDNGIKDKTRSFKPTDTIYASIDTKGASAGTPVNAVFKFQDGQIVHQDSITIAPDGKAKTEFHIQKADGFPVGDYSVEIRVGTNEPKSQNFKVTN